MILCSGIVTFIFAVKSMIFVLRNMIYSVGRQRKGSRLCNSKKNSL